MSSSLSSIVGGVKGAVIEVLAAESPLSAKEVWRRASKNKACTYQGVHKALRELEAEKAVERAQDGYALNRNWLRGLSEELSEYSAKREAAKPPFTTAKHGLSSTFQAISLLNNLLLRGELRFSRDEMVLQGTRVTLTPLNLLLAFHNELRKKSGPNFVYLESKRMGVGWFRNLRAKGFSKGSIDEEVRMGIEALTLAGNGRLEMDLIDLKDRHITALMHYSPTASEYLEIYGSSKFPVDDIIRGALAGGWQVIIGDPTIECVETQCIACGAPKCVFEVRPRGQFDTKNALVRRQLSKC